MSADNRPPHGPRFTIRDARPDERDSIGEVLTIAYEPTALGEWLDREPVSRTVLLQARLRALITAVQSNNGTARVACESNEIVAAALWQPCFADSSHPAFDSRPGSRESGEWRARELGDALAAAHPSEPHLHLVGLGVVSPWQRCGLGRALLTDPDAHIVPIPVYTEAAGRDYSAWLRRHHFRDYYPSPTLLPRSTVSIWPLWRTA